MANADTLEGAGVNSGNALDAAKLQNNSETTKDLAKKHCHRRTTEHEPNRVANSSSLEDGEPFFPHYRLSPQIGQPCFRTRHSYIRALQ